MAEDAGSLAGKIAVVTGATAGIGKHTALGLARCGMVVVITGRDPERAREAKAWIEARHPAARVTTELADFASFAQVRALAGRLLSAHREITILVNNAGLIMTHRVTTADGFEMTWQVNHLAPFLLTNLLLPALKEAAPARIVTVASNAARSGRINFSDVNRERHILGLAYPQSKLANVMFTYGLARRLRGTGVTAVAVHPGFVASNFGRKGALWNAVWAVLRPFQISEEEGAKSPLFAATTANAGAISGCFLMNMRPASARGQANDPEAVERLWRASAEMVGIAA